MICKNLYRTSQFVLQTQKQNQINKIYSAFSTQKFSEKLKNVRSTGTQQTETQNQQYTQHTADIVKSNVGLTNYIQRVYKASGAGILAALASSQVAIGMGLPFASPMGCAIGGLVLGLGGMFGTMRMSTKQITEYINGEQQLRTENSPLRIGLYGLGMAGLGLSASPLFAMVSMQNPMILPTAIGLSSGVFGAASLYAYMKPKDSLLSWGSALQSGLIGLIGLQVVGGLTTLCIGPNMFSHCIHRFDTFAGVGIFSALVAYDTHCAIKSYEDGNADHLATSLDFALDFWNILVRMTQILSMFSGND